MNPSSPENCLVIHLDGRIATEKLTSIVCIGHKVTSLEKRLLELNNSTGKIIHRGGLINGNNNDYRLGKTVIISYVDDISLPINTFGVGTRKQCDCNGEIHSYHGIIIISANRGGKHVELDIIEVRKLLVSETEWFDINGTTTCNVLVRPRTINYY